MPKQSTTIDGQDRGRTKEAVERLRGANALLETPMRDRPRHVDARRALDQARLALAQVQAGTPAGAKPR